MKRIISIIVLMLFVIVVPMTHTGCTTPTDKRVAAVQTLKAVGQTAEAAVMTSAQLYAAKTINASQARQIADLYDNKFQPAYRVAVTAVNSNLDSIASPDLVALAAQLSGLVLSFSQK